MHDPELGAYMQAKMRYYLQLHKVKMLDMALGTLGLYSTEEDKRRYYQRISLLTPVERTEYLLYRSYHRNRLN